MQGHLVGKEPGGQEVEAVAGREGGRGAHLVRVDHPRGEVLGREYPTLLHSKCLLSYHPLKQPF